MGRKLGCRLAEARRDADQALVHRPYIVGGPGPRAGRDHVGDLEEVGAVDRDHHARTRLDERIVLARRLRDPEPEHVHRRGDTDRCEAGRGPKRRVTTGCIDDQPRAELHSALRGDAGHADGAPSLAHDVVDAGGAQQPEAGMPFGLGGQEVEEVPLRHERHDLARCRQMSEVGHRQFGAVPAEGDVRGIGVRASEELVEEAEFTQQFLGRRVDGVAAEVAEEVGVLLDHRDVDALAHEEQSEHEAGGAAAHDDAIGVDAGVHAHSVVAPSHPRKH